MDTREPQDRPTKRLRAPLCQAAMFWRVRSASVRRNRAPHSWGLGVVGCRPPFRYSGNGPSSSDGGPRCAFVVGRGLDSASLRGLLGEQLDDLGHRGNRGNPLADTLGPAVDLLVNDGSGCLVAASCLVPVSMRSAGTFGRPLGSGSIMTRWASTLRLDSSSCVAPWDWIDAGAEGQDLLSWTAAAWRCRTPVAAVVTVARP